MAARVPPERVAVALKLLAQYVPAVEVERQIAELFGVSLRVARRAVSEARRQLTDSIVIDRDEKRAKLRAALEQVLRDTLEAKHHRTALQAIAALAELDGLNEATRVAVEHGFVADSSSPMLGKRALAERMAELDARAKAEDNGDGSN